MLIFYLAEGDTEVSGESVTSTEEENGLEVSASGSITTSTGSSCKCCKC